MSSGDIECLPVGRPAPKGSRGKAKGSLDGPTTPEPAITDGTLAIIVGPTSIELGPSLGANVADRSSPMGTVPPWPKASRAGVFSRSTVWCGLAGREVGGLMGDGSGASDLRSSSSISRAPVSVSPALVR